MRSTLLNTLGDVYLMVGAIEHLTQVECDREWMLLSEPRYFDDKPARPNIPDYLKPRPTTDLSKKHEKETAAKTKGRRVAGSGNQLGKPGDVIGAKDLQELKATDKVDETRIELAWLRKISYEALTQGRYPVVNMRFTRLKPPAVQDWVLIPAHIYDRLKEGQSS